MYCSVVVVWFVCYVNPNGFVAIVPSAGFGFAAWCAYSFLAAGFLVASGLCGANIGLVLHLHCLHKASKQET